MTKLPKITLEGQNLSANYASEFQVLHTANDFILSVIELIPLMTYEQKEIMNPTTNQPANVTRLRNDGLLKKIIGRYGMSPATFKKLVNVLNQNLKQYETKFGEIAIQQPEFMH